MTDDAVAVLDALGWEQAHIFGASLGGVIAQRIALRHPGRVLSVVSAMAMPSDTTGIGGARHVRFGLLARLGRAKFPEGREGDIDLSLMLARELASPAYPFDEDATREWIERQVDRRRQLTVPVLWCCRVPATIFPRRCGRISRARSASSPTGPVPRKNRRAGAG